MNEWTRKRDDLLVKNQVEKENLWRISQQHQHGDTYNRLSIKALTNLLVSSFITLNHQKRDNFSNFIRNRFSISFFTHLLKKLRMNRAAIFIPVTVSLLLLGLSYFPQASAECCETSCGQCADCTRPTPYCGVFHCNMFGCNCDGGCRTGGCQIRCKNRRKNMAETIYGLFSGRRRRAVWDQVEIFKNVSQIIKSADRNYDEKLDLVEAVHFLKLKNVAHLEEVEIERAFKELDTNGDHFLSSTEIDNR